MNEPIIIRTTLEKREDAVRLARLLLEKRLIACAQIFEPEQSFYWWQGEITDASEILLTIKTDRSLFPKIEQLIKAEHPYQVPEIVATAIICGNREYLEWLAGELVA